MVETLTLYSSIILVLYVVIMFYLGYRGYKVAGDNMEGYTLARGYLSPIAVGVAYAATLASTIVFIGIPGWGYVAGLSVLWHTFLFWGAAVVAMLVVAKMFRRIGTAQGSLSLPEWIGDRYGSDYLKVIFGLLVIANILYVGAQFAGLAIIFEYVIGIPFEMGILGALILVTAYTFLGGTYTDVMTDYLQGIIMAILGITVLLSIFWVFGGFGEMVSELQTQSPQLVAPTNPNFPLFAGVVQIIAVMLFGFIIGFQPQLANKYLSLDDERDIKLFVASGAVSLFLFYFMILAGPAARAVNPELGTPDAATMVYLIEAFPTLVVAIFGAALLSAGISTTDGLIVSIGTALGNDIYRSVLADTENASEKQLEAIEKRSVLITRIVVIAVGIVAAAMVLSDPPQFIATFASIGIFIFVSAAFPPTILGLFWRGGTAGGVIASAIVGPTLFILWTLGILTVGIASIYVAGVLATLLSGVAMVAVSQITPAVDQETVDAVIR